MQIVSLSDVKQENDQVNHEAKGGAGSKVRTESGFKSERTSKCKSQTITRSALF